MPSEDITHPIIKRLRQVQPHKLDLKSGFRLSVEQMIDSTINCDDIASAIVSRFRESSLSYLAEGNLAAFQHSLETLSPGWNKRAEVMLVQTLGRMRGIDARSLSERDSIGLLSSLGQIAAIGSKPDTAVAMLAAAYLKIGCYESHYLRPPGRPIDELLKDGLSSSLTKDRRRLLNILPDSGNRGWIAIKQSLHNSNKLS